MCIRFLDEIYNVIVSIIFWCWYGKIQHHFFIKKKMTVLLQHAMAKPDLKGVMSYASHLFSIRPTLNIKTIVLK